MAYNSNQFKNKKETEAVNMKGRIDNKMGSIQIDPEVIAMYAGTTAVECFGIVGMAAVSMKDGLVRLLKKESLTHGINVAIKDNALSIDFHVIVAYGDYSEHLRDFCRLNGIELVL